MYKVLYSKIAITWISYVQAFLWYGLYKSRAG